MKKPFTNIIPNQPTILIISNFLKESAFSKSKTSRASQGWEAVKNHMWPDEPVQAGYVTFRGVRKLKHSCHTQEIVIDWSCKLTPSLTEVWGGQPPIKSEV